VLEGKITLSQLKDTWSEVKGKDDPDNPIAYLKRKVEAQELFKKIEKAEDPDSFLNVVKAFKELGLIGNNNQTSGESALVQVLQTQLAVAQKQSDDYRRTLEDLRTSSNQQMIAALETKMTLQLAAIEQKTMTKEDWENNERLKYLWAKEKGLSKDGETPQDKSFNRLDKGLKTVEKLPDKFSESLDRGIDKLINGADKISQVQERRRLQIERRNHLQQLGLSGKNMEMHNLSTQNPNAFLDQVEQKADQILLWQELAEKGEDIKLKEKKQNNEDDLEVS